MLRRLITNRALWALTLVLILSENASSYSVLAHQALVDLLWQDRITPLLLKRFPDLTPEQLRDAHAHAYGGCIIQDMGYYPFSNKYFSDLLHYVRSGDFIEMLIAESQDANEYAFALGALAHYAADNSGHALGTNRVVPIYYPKLRRKYGDLVTYEQNPSAHIKAEFGFDVLQVARGNYASEDYHNFIGFKVAKPVLERAFFKTYGIKLSDVITNQGLAFNTYRRAVSRTIPYMTKVAWEIKKDEISKLVPNMSRERFVYSYSREQYEQEFGKQYRKPSLLQKTLALFFRVLPKVGPLRALEFKTPTLETERIFAESFLQVSRDYKRLLEEIENGQFDFENRDFDTGQLTRAGEYGLTDKTYMKLLSQLDKEKFKNITPALKADIVRFFNDLKTLPMDKKNRKKWHKTEQALNRLRTTL
ncbi:MAG: zinc dependent phospholipase C family protein [Acidobacteriota bacterium]